MLGYTTEKIALRSWLNLPVIKFSRPELPALFVRKIPTDAVYLSRFHEEMELIRRSNFGDVFINAALIVRDLKCQYICRGSAASSLVCWLLGITHIDPIAHKMQFARFLNSKRNNQPDIDLDFPQNLRDQIFSRVYSLFNNQVGHIVNHVFYRERSAHREALRQTHGDICDDTKIIAKKLQDTHRLDTLHCGGIIIFDKPIPKNLIPKTSRGKFVPKLTVNKKETEAEGYVKLDILANRGLSILNECDPVRQICDYPLDDEKIIAALAECDVIGITFVETPLVIRVMRILKPRSPTELSLCLALVRPGPDKKRIIAQHCSQGVLVYDDDVIEYISEILDVDVAEGDTIRKILSKGRDADWDAFEQKLLDRWSPLRAQAIIQNCQLVKKYTFCKSHSLNYAYMCWAMLWHKVHNPAKFWAAVLTHANSQYEKWVYYREAIDNGFNVELSKGKVWKATGKYLHTSSSPAKQTRLTTFFSDWAKIKQLRDYGYWIDGPMGFCGADDRAFCGIIACSRRYKCEDNSIVNFVTISIGPKKFCNVTVSGELHRDSMFISGSGKRNGEWEIFADSWKQW
jgi:DNA polymerase III alpha subunit